MVLKKCSDFVNSGCPTERVLQKVTMQHSKARPALHDVCNKVVSNFNGNNVLKETRSLKPDCPLMDTKGISKENVIIKNIKKTTELITKKEVLKVNGAIKINNKLKSEKTVGASKSYSSNQLCLIDPDDGTKNDPQMVTEYTSDIFNYLRELECKYLIRKKYLEGHQSTSKMRSVLVNWLVEVHMNFKFYLETLYLCVAIVDRYLQNNKNVGKETLQLVGTSALFTAAKYEEIYIPNVEDLVYICDDIFSNKQIIQMESEILIKLDFSLGRPLPIHFLRHYNRIAQVRQEHHSLGKYILELALLEHDMCHIRPSIQAAAACCLSIAILNEVMNPAKVWTSKLVTHTTYEYSDFKSVLVSMANLVFNAKKSKYQTIQKKYALASNNKISLNRKLCGPLIWKLTSSTT